MEEYKISLYNIRVIVEIEQAENGFIVRTNVYDMLEDSKNTDTMVYKTLDEVIHAINRYYRPLEDFDKSDVDIL